MTLNAPATAPTRPDPGAMLQWFAQPEEALGPESLGTLQDFLDTLRQSPASPQQRHKLLDLIYQRAMALGRALGPEVSASPLPLGKKMRQQIRQQQRLLEALALDYLADVENPVDLHLVKGLRQPPEVGLWRMLQCLYLHLLISALAAAPAGIRIWQTIHRAYRLAQSKGLSRTTPSGETEDIARAYGSTLLLACAQPASYSGEELAFVATMTHRLSEDMEILSVADERHHGLFWVDPERDGGPVAMVRRLPPPETTVLWFSCDRLARQLDAWAEALNAGTIPESLQLPPEAATPTGQGLMHRLAKSWGHPAKRRFPRRRQSFRAKLCLGLEQLWRTLEQGEREDSPLSQWMVTNESPEGYAIMHLAGHTTGLAVGNVVALKRENGADWEICLVRWALSENPEHLELGLQILAPRAIPAAFAVPGATQGPTPGALLFPPIPGLRPEEHLLAPAGALRPDMGMVLLLLQQGHLAVREIGIGRLEEQTGAVETFAIAPYAPAPASNGADAG